LYEVDMLVSSVKLLQWASLKTRIPYDFNSYVGRTELGI
jgi:hypothetical protein